MLEDRAFELAQVGTRLEAKLVSKPHDRLAVHRQRVTLSSAPVQSTHQLTPQSLVRWMLGDQHLQLRDQLSVPTERKVGLDALLDRLEPKLLHTPNRRLRERLIGDVGQRPAAPQRQRLAEHRGSTRRLGSARLSDEPLEPCQVKLVWLDLQHIPSRHRHQPRRARAERPTQLRNTHLQRRAPGLRQILSP